MLGDPTNLNIVEQGPTVLAVCASGGCLYIFFVHYHILFLSHSLWTSLLLDIRLKYCLKQLLNSNQPLSFNPFV